jgi:hypothetical protein
MKFYSVTKENEILSFTGKWMELENIILSEGSQDQKPKATHSSSYTDYTPKTNAAILWGTGHTKGKVAYGRDNTKEGNQKLECG